MGLEVPEDHFYTSALATARFLSSQAPGCSAYVIGAPGLVGALYDVGITMNDVNPDYVVVGETMNYYYDSIIKAVGFVQKGARLVATNSDLTGPSENGIIPACRALVAPIELATGRSAYYVGKPNPLMMRTGLKMLGCHSAEAGDGGGQNGYRHCGGNRDRSGHRAGALRLHRCGGPETLSLPPRPRALRSGGDLPPGIISPRPDAAPLCPGALFRFL